MFKDLVVKKTVLLDINLTDSTSFKFTNHFKDDGSYNVDTFDISDVTNYSGLEVPSFQVYNISDSTLRAKAINGFLLKADITATLKNMADDSTYVLFKGQIQRADIADNWVDVDCQGFVSLADQNLNIYYTKQCLNDLGDSICGVNLATFTDSGTVTTVNSRSSFIDTSLSKADDYYQFGNVEFTSGANNGISREVLSYTSSTDTVKMFIPFPFDIEVGDSYDINRGCQKDVSDCQSIFDNFDRFRGYAIYTPDPDDLRYDADDDDEDDINDEDDDSDDEVL